jgi:excisionase family DNA binding protein
MTNLESSTMEDGPDVLVSREKLKRIINGSLASNDLMGVDQAAQFLGVSKPTLYLKTSKKEVPFHKVPGTKKLWFSREELTAWIKGWEV